MKKMKPRVYNMNKVVGDKKTDFVNMQIRRFTIPLTGIIAKHTHITPNQVSIISIIISFPCLIFFTLGGYWNMIIGSIFLILITIIDHVDGKLARVLGTHSSLGHWLDSTRDMVFLPLLMVSIAVGTGAYFVGMFASIAYAIHFLLCFMFKADFSNKVEKEKIHLVEKESRLRFLYGGHVAYQLIPVACVFNVPIWSLWFFAIIGNLFWMALILMQYRIITRYGK